MTFAQEMLEQGSLQHGREILVRQLNRKFGLNDLEREQIMACDDQAAIDAALDEILDADAKAQVLAKLS